MSDRLSDEGIELVTWLRFTKRELLVQLPVVGSFIIVTLEVIEDPGWAWVVGCVSGAYLAFMSIVLGDE